MTAEAATTAQTANSTNVAISTTLIGRDGEWWDGLVIWSLMAAVLVAAAVAAATAGASLVHKREASAAKRALGLFQTETAGKVADASAAGIAAGAAAGRAQTAVDAANVELAKQKTLAAEANARALEARLALEQFKAPRVLTPEQLDGLTEALRPYAGVPFDFSIVTDPEAIALMEQIGGALTRAGLRWVPISGGVYFEQPGFPRLGIIGASGLAVQYDGAKEREWELPARAIWHTLEATGLAIRAVRVTDSTVAANAIHLYVGRKPN